MSMEIAKPTARISSGFRQIVAVFLAGEGLPFSQILAAERIERICGQHGCLFGQRGIFSTPVVLWAFLSQVLRDGKEAACQAAVASIAAARLERGEEPPTEDTGDYCRARAKLAPRALKAISCEVAEELEQVVDSQWTMLGRRGQSPRSEKQHLIEVQEQHSRQIRQALAASDRVTLLEVSYPDLVADPAPVIEKLAALLPGRFSPSPAVAACVKPTLYRNRGGTG